MEQVTTEAVQLPLGAKITWQLRRHLWNSMVVVKYLGQKPDKIKAPPKKGEHVHYIPMSQAFPSIPITSITVGDKVPKDELKKLKRVFVGAEAWLIRNFGPHQPSLPPIAESGADNLRWAYGPVKRSLFPPPAVPEAYAHDLPDLGELAMAGPFWGYLLSIGDDRWQWDVRELARFEHWPGLRSLGVRVEFARDATGRKPQAVRIECSRGVFTPADREWPEAVRLAMCAIATHAGLVRHFNAIHLAFGAKFSQATRNQLPWDHPLFRFIWPHIHDSQSSNELVTISQMTPTGDFPSILSFTHQGMCRLFEDTHRRLRLQTFDVERDAIARGEVGKGLDTPGYDNVKDLFDLWLSHATKCIHAYYDSDAALANDPSVEAWLAELREHIPNGIPLEPNELTRASLARLIAVFFNVVITEHALRNNGPWDYILWNDRVPARVYEDGRREPVDVYQRLVNANLVFQARRTIVTEDFSHVALDERGRALFRELQADLNALQERYSVGPRLRWKIYPDALNANMNA